MCFGYTLLISLLNSIIALDNSAYFQVSILLIVYFMH